VLNVQNSRAIILAAGLSTRMGSLAAGRPKCLLELHGLSVLQHQLDALHQLGVGRVTIVTGHGAEAVRAAAGEQAEFIHFDGYAGGNNLRTLHHARTLLEGDVVVLFADVLLTMATLGDLVRHSAPMALLVDESTCRPDTMRVRLENDRVVDIGPHIGVGGGHGNFVGVAAFRAAGWSWTRRRMSRWLLGRTSTLFRTRTGRDGSGSSGPIARAPPVDTEKGEPPCVGSSVSCASTARP